MKKRVLFVCIGNAIRSQMAEGFARALGRDCIAPASGGLAPANRIDPTAVKVMADIGIDIGEHFPKYYQAFERMEFDHIVNISGHLLPGKTPACPVTSWEVEDPVGKEEERYRDARDSIQKLMLQLLEQLRSSEPERIAPAAPPGAPMLDRRRRLRQT